jgi:tetratricopeptide (TPR) repeat protein
MLRKIPVILILCFCLSCLISIPAWALNLEKAKAYFLNGDYAACINEGEKIIAGSSHAKGTDELYYLLGLSYLKEGNYLRASDIFEIILKEFKNSRFTQESKLGLGDTYFLRADFEQAKVYYKALLSDNPHTKLEPIVYYRLSQCALKRGDSAQAQEYLCKIKDVYSLSLEMRLNQDSSCALISYSVQVGSFANQQNAKNMTEKLIQKGYSAYIEESNLQDKITYRVRVGKFKSRQETTNLSEKLSQDGFPTKIYP